MFCRKCGKAITGEQCDNPGCQNANRLSECTGIPEGIETKFKAFLQSRQDARMPGNDAGRAPSEQPLNEKPGSGGQTSTENIVRKTDGTRSAGGRECPPSGIPPEADNAGIGQKPNAKNVKRKNRPSPPGSSINGLKIYILSILTITVVLVAILVIQLQNSVTYTASRSETRATVSEPPNYVSFPESENTRPAPHPQNRSTPDTDKKSAADSLTGTEDGTKSASANPEKKRPVPPFKMDPPAEPEHSTRGNAQAVIDSSLTGIGALKAGNQEPPQQRATQPGDQSAQNQADPEETTDSRENSAPDADEPAKADATEQNSQVSQDKKKPVEPPAGAPGSESLKSVQSDTASARSEPVVNSSGESAGSDSGLKSKDDSDSKDVSEKEKTQPEQNVQ